MITETDANERVEIENEQFSVFFLFTFLVKEGASTQVLLSQQ